MDPLDLHQVKAKSFVQYEHDNDTDDIPDGLDPILMTLKSHKNNGRSLVQLPHEDDTDDIALEVSPVAYDSHHSKMWNNAVDKKAQEIESEIQIEENLKIAKKKAAEEAQRKATEERARIAEERRRKEEEKKKEAEENSKKGITALPQQPAVDLGELYSNLVPDEDTHVQTGYEHHTSYWDDKVEAKAQSLAGQM